MSDIIIIGGGASGIMSAISAKMHNPAAAVTVLERSPKALKKLLATGNGRCNMLNCEISENNYHGNSLQAVNIIKKVGVDFLISLFEDFGLSVSRRFAPLIYPASFQASSVREALLTAAYDRGVKIYTDFEITDVKPTDSGFTVISKKDKNLTCKKLILTGGTSATAGSDSCIDFLSSLSHSVTPTYCALVPITCSEAGALKLANGARAYVKLTLLCDGEEVKSDFGEVQFCDYGLSGIVTMQLSGDCVRLLGEGKEPQLSVSLFDNMSEIERKLLSDRDKFKRCSVFSRLSLMINSLIAKSLLFTADIDEAKPFCELTNSEIQKIAALLCDMRFTPTGSKGERFAQVFGGGGDLCDFDENLRSKKNENLYCAGEMLNVYGDCGGYNLTWAWASGYVAGKAAAEECRI